MKVLITGGHGLLAHALARQAPKGAEVVLLGHQEFDLQHTAQMQEQLAGLHPHVVINTAAYNLVDQCEIERELSWAINAAAPGVLGRLCGEFGAKLIHYGTDYIFDGSKGAPYTESDTPRPLNHYA